jgi:hypothetical protein
VDGPADAKLVGGAGVPADPDPGPGLVGFGQQGDVGDQGAQQPLAVVAAGGGIVPEPGQVAGEFLQLGPAWQRRQRLRRGFQCLLDVGELGEAGFPPCFQAAGDEPVFRLDGGEGAVGVVACALDGQLRGAARASATCSAVSASSSTPATAASTVEAATDRQEWVVNLSMRPEHWQPGPAHTALARPAWWDHHDTGWEDTWLHVATEARRHSPKALTTITRAAITGALEHVSRSYGTQRYQQGRRPGPPRLP